MKTFLIFSVLLVTYRTEQIVTTHAVGHLSSLCLVAHRALVSVITFFYGRGLSALCPTPNLEGQWDHSSSGPYPSTCLAWVSLPGVWDSSHWHSSRGHWVTGELKPPNHDKVAIPIEADMQLVHDVFIKRSVHGLDRILQGIRAWRRTRERAREKVWRFFYKSTIGKSMVNGVLFATKYTVIWLDTITKKFSIRNNNSVYKFKLKFFELGLFT